MSVKSVLEIIAAAYQNTPIEVHRMGQWCTWTGSIIALVREMQTGTVFRVKRVPRTIWAEQDSGRRLYDVCWTDEKDAIAEIGDGNAIVEFREVL